LDSATHGNNRIAVVTLFRSADPFIDKSVHSNYVYMLVSYDYFAGFFYFLQ